MKGMLYKDFQLSRKNLVYYLAFYLLYAVLVIGGAMPASIIAGMVVILAVSLPLAAFSWDQATKWDCFAAALPGGRRAVISARYLLILLLILAGAVLSVLLLLVLSLLGLAEGTVAELFLPVPVCSAVALGLDAVLLPLAFRFGVEKSRLLGMIIFFGCFGGIALGTTLYKGRVPALLTGHSAAVLLLAASLLCAVLFLVSWQVSLAIYRKKEF